MESKTGRKPVIIRAPEPNPRGSAVQMSIAYFREKRVTRLITKPCRKGPESLSNATGEKQYALGDQCWIVITTGSGGDELMLAGDGTPLIEMEIGYIPAGIDANCCGTVKLI
jgi:hypothetical protein